MNYNAKINLSKLNKTFTANIKGTDETKRCLCIPIEDNYLFIGEKGIYFDMIILELKNQTDKQTHMIKPSIPKEKYEAMTQLLRDAVPIIGNITPFGGGNSLPGIVQPDSTENIPY